MDHLVSFQYPSRGVPEAAARRGRVAPIHPGIRPGITLARDMSPDMMDMTTGPRAGEAPARDAGVSGSPWPETCPASRRDGEAPASRAGVSPTSNPP